MNVSKALILAAGIALAGSQAGHAANLFSYDAINPTQPLTGTVENFSSFAGSNIANESSATATPLTTAFGTLTFSHAQIVYGAQGGEFAVPYGTSQTGNYLSVYNNPGIATFTITKPATTFEIDWGSIDPSNQILFTDSQGDQFALTGSMVNANANGDQGINGTDLVVVTSKYNLVSAVLTSGQNSFEVGAVSVSAVPLPGALTLFGAGLVGLGAYGWRKGRRKDA